MSDPYRAWVDDFTIKVQPILTAAKDRLRRKLEDDAASVYVDTSRVEYIDGGPRLSIPIIIRNRFSILRGFYVHTPREEDIDQSTLLEAITAFTIKLENALSYIDKPVCVPQAKLEPVEIASIDDQPADDLKRIRDYVELLIKVREKA